LPPDAQSIWLSNPSRLKSADFQPASAGLNS